MIRLTNEVKKLTTDLEASLCRAERAEKRFIIVKKLSSMICTAKS